MKTAQDLMTKDPIIIQSGHTLDEVSHVFTEHNITSAPVVTPSNEILGVLTDLNLVKAKIHLKIGSASENKVYHYRKFLNATTILKASTPVSDVIQQMIKDVSHRIYIENKAGKIIGVVSPKDILRFLNGESNKSLNLKIQLEETKHKLESLEGQLEAVLEDLEKYKDIFYDTPTMIHSTDGDGKILMANKKIHETLGYNDGELVGKTIFDIYPKSVQHEAVAGLKKIIETGHHQNTYTSMVTKNGEKLRVDIASSALYTKDHKFLGTISVSRHIDSEALLRALHGVINTQPASEE